MVELGGRGIDTNNNKQLDSGYILKEKPTGSVLTKVKDDLPRLWPEQLKSGSGLL